MGEKSTVSGKDLVASVPPVRIRHRVGVQVPAAIVGIPVRVHGPESFSYLKPSVPPFFEPPTGGLSELNLMRSLTP